MVVLFLLTVSSYAVPPQGGDAAEDYKLLKEIIVKEFSSEKPQEWGDMIPGVKTHLKTQEKVIAIGLGATDLSGQGEELSLIRFFESENIPMTLFVSGGWMDRNRALLKRLAGNPLFEIANHGLEEKPCSTNGKSAAGIQGTRNIEELFSEIEQNARKIEAITGILPQYYRSGAGYYDEIAVKVIKALGYEPIGSGLRLSPGNALTRKQVLEAFSNPSAGAIAMLQSEALNKTVSGGIMEAIRKLRSRGYKFVKLSDYPLE